MDEVRRPLENVQSLAVLKQGQVEQFAQHHVQLGFDYHRGQKFYHLSGQTLPLFDCSHSK